MRSKNPFIVLKYDTNGDGSITYLCNNGKWIIGYTPGYNANQIKFWNNSGNAWHCIAKLVKNKKEKFENLFVWSLNGLTPFTENDSISFSMIQSLSTDQGILDAIVHEALTEKSEQIELLQETLDMIRFATNFPNAEY